jgi:hypothetical protein
MDVRPLQQGRASLVYYRVVSVARVGKSSALNSYMYCRADANCREARRLYPEMYPKHRIQSHKEFTKFRPPLSEPRSFAPYLNAFFTVTNRTINSISRQTLISGHKLIGTFLLIGD